MGERARGWLVAALVLLCGGWMAFDGGRALLVGDYVTPSSGRHAGQLGPWAPLVEAAGIAPRSTAMKAIFLVYGALYLSAATALLAGWGQGRTAVLSLAILGLWYLPFGTLINLVVIALVATGGPRTGAA